MGTDRQSQRAHAQHSRAEGKQPTPAYPIRLSVCTGAWQLEAWSIWGRLGACLHCIQPSLILDILHTHTLLPQETRVPRSRGGGVWRPEKVGLKGRNLPGNDCIWELSFFVMVPMVTICDGKECGTGAPPPDWDALYLERRS